MRSAVSLPPNVTKMDRALDRIFECEWFASLCTPLIVVMVVLLGTAIMVLGFIPLVLYLLKCRLSREIADPSDHSINQTLPI